MIVIVDDRLARVAAVGVALGRREELAARRRVLADAEARVIGRADDRHERVRRGAVERGGDGGVAVLDQGAEEAELDGPRVERVRGGARRGVGDDLAEVRGEAGEAHARDHHRVARDRFPVVEREEAGVRRARALAPRRDRVDGERRLERPLDGTVGEVHALVEEVRQVAGVLLQRLVVEEEVRELDLPVVGEDAERVLVDADVLGPAFDVEVLAEELGEGRRRLRRVERVLLRGLEEAAEAVHGAPEVRVGGALRGQRGAGLGDLVLEPGEDRRSGQAADALREEPLVMGAINEPDTLG